LQAIPQYYLTGYSGGPLGHGVELLVALPLLAGVLLGGWRLLAAPVRGAPQPARSPSSSPASPALAPSPAPALEDDSSPARPRQGAAICLWIAAFAVLAPIVLAVAGADYLAPRNLVGAMIPLSVLIAILFAAIDGPSTPTTASGRRGRDG
jgi:hypothetical protein